MADRELETRQPVLTRVKDAVGRFGIVISLVMACALMGGMMVSCDDDEPDYSPLTGTWLACDATGLDYNELVFYSNGTGLYYAYNDLGVWTMWTTSWDINGSRLTIYINETGQTWRYTWALKGYYLYLDDGYSRMMYELE